MLVSEAFEKVSSEINEYVAEKLGQAPDAEVNELVMQDATELFKNDSYFAFLYDGSARDFIMSRSTKSAQHMIDDLTAAGFDFSTLTENVDVVMDDLISKWHEELLHIFALGYSFAAPEFQGVPKDEEGFLHRCRQTDVDLITIQVDQFASDKALRDIFEQRINLAAAFMSGMFNFLRKPATKFVVRDWYQKVHSTVSLNCFIGGHKVRDLLEEELAFEAMLKGDELS